MLLWGQEWEKISGTKKVNRFRPPEVRSAMTALELARERLQLAAEQVRFYLVMPTSKLLLVELFLLFRCVCVI